MFSIVSEFKLNQTDLIIFELIRTVLFLKADFVEIRFCINISHEFPAIVSSLVLNHSSFMRFRTKVLVDENGFLDCEDITFARLTFHKHSCPRNYL